VNVVGHDSDRAVTGGPRRMQWDAGSALDSRAPPTLGVQK
jgi:hypothetical protein